MTRTLVLDLDGTLVDSVPDIAAAVNRLLASRLLPGLAEHAVQLMVGDGTDALIERAFAAHGALPDAQAAAEYVADYTARSAEATEAYPGVTATLRAMHGAGWRLAVCTNKPEAAAHRVLRALGLDGFFAAVGGGDSFAGRKPDPVHLLGTIAAAGGAPGRAVMAGDHANDVLAAQAAGVPSVFAAWGYGTPAMAEGAGAVAERFDELPVLAARLLG